MPCLMPVPIKDGNNQLVYVPCGKCPQCRSARASAWSFRLLQELKVSTSAHFLTLTYDTKHVPITRNGFMSLDKRHYQLFMKRLRKRNRNRLKYYCAGEYGETYMRPHYHVIMFNVDVKTIQDAWELGSVHYGKVEEASVGYTLKYISKPGRIPLHRNDDRVPEFGLMSKGLGISYLSDEMIAWHHADLETRMYCNIMDGKKIGMPRYFKNKLYTDEQRKTIAAYALAAQADKIVKRCQRLSPSEFADFMRNHKEAIKAEYARNAEKQLKPSKF